jgi:hypothetical protein
MSEREGVSARTRASDMGREGSGASTWPRWRPRTLWFLHGRTRLSVCEAGTGVQERKSPQSLGVARCASCWVVMVVVRSSGVGAWRSAKKGGETGRHLHMFLGCDCCLGIWLFLSKRVA